MPNICKHFAIFFHVVAQLHFSLPALCVNPKRIDNPFNEPMFSWARGRGENGTAAELKLFDSICTVSESGSRASSYARDLFTRWSHCGQGAISIAKVDYTSNKWKGRATRTSRTNRIGIFCFFDLFDALQQPRLTTRLAEAETTRRTQRWNENAARPYR